MFKVFALLKRRPGMSMEDFMDYYENHHAPLGVKAMKSVRYYARHYMTPTLDPVSGQPSEAAYDAITEMHFDDRHGFDEFMALLQNPRAKAYAEADEEKLFDRSKNSMVFVTTCESELRSA